MKILFLLIVMFFVGIGLIKADDPADGDFLSLLEQVKNPFKADFPKPPENISVPVEKPKPKYIKPVKPVVKHEEKVVLPELTLNGVVLGEDIHQAIIDDQLVALQETIKGAQVVDVSKEGVALLYKGKRFFLKIEE
jgi:hypothetical protein